MLFLVAVAIVAVTTAQAQTFNVIYNFNDNAIGSEPNAGVTLDAHGNVYGTNMFYGAGYGTVYKLSNRSGNWVVSVLYTFTGGMDGAFPASRVVIGPDGSLYGTTSEGGGNGCQSHGCGTVFKLSPSPNICRAISCPWEETVLYRFTGGPDGAAPENGDIIFDSAGSILWYYQRVQLQPPQSWFGVQADQLRRRVDGKHALHFHGWQRWAIPAWRRDF